MEIGQQSSGQQQNGVNQVVAINGPLQLRHSGVEIQAYRPNGACRAAIDESGCVAWRRVIEYGVG